MICPAFEKRDGMEDRKRETEEKEEPVAAPISRGDKQVTSTVTHRHPPVTTGLNETRPWRSSVLSPVLSPSTITLHLLNRQQTFIRTDRHAAGPPAVQTPRKR